jgi:hypothetical protein
MWRVWRLGSEVSEPLGECGRETQVGLAGVTLGPSNCRRASSRRSHGYRWFSGPRTRGKLYVSGVDTLWADCVLDVLMFGVHLWFTERGDRSAAVLGNHPISVRSTTLLDSTTTRRQSRVQR